jgi:outer membrane protein assembly factor BamB
LTSWAFSIEGKPYALILDEGVRIHCISLLDGNNLWTFSMEHGEILGCILTEHLFCVLGDDGFTYGLSLETGLVLWKIHLKGHFIFPPAYHQGSLILVADVEPGYNGFLYHIDPLTGKTRSCHQMPMSPAQRPYFVNSCAIIPLECPRQSLLWAMDITLDKPTWSIKIDSLQIDLPTLTWVPSRDEHSSDGVLVVKTDNGHCMGIDLKNGEVIWRTPLLSQGEILTENLPPQCFDQYLLIPERYLSVLDPMTGERVYRLDKLPEHASYLQINDGLKLTLGRGDDQIELYSPSGFLALS